MKSISILLAMSVVGSMPVPTLMNKAVYLNAFKSKENLEAAEEQKVETFSKAFNLPDEVILRDQGTDTNPSYLKWKQANQQVGEGIRLKKRGFCDCYEWTQPFALDLDGEGQVDQIRFLLGPKDEDGCGTCQLQINEASITLKPGFYEQKIWVVDIDPEDDYRELIIHDQGLSNDSVDRYYYYDGAEIREMGEVTGHLNESLGEGPISEAAIYWVNSIRNYIEKGVVHSVKRNDILGTTWCPQDYVLYEAHHLKPIEDERPGLAAMHVPLLTKQAVRLYQSPSLNAPQWSYAEGKSLVAVANDEKEWVQVQLENGQLAWLNTGEMVVYDYFYGPIFAD